MNLAVGHHKLFAQKKNVLFIVVDDLRPALGCYGDSAASTPHIDQLASRGTIFTQAYCQQAVCAPSRASFMTGRKPDRSRVWNLDTHFRKALPDVVTLPQYFKNQGYYTRQIGKIYHDPASAQDPASWSVASLFGITTNTGKYVLDSNLKHAPKALVAEAADVADSAYIDGMVAAAAVKELAAADKPFFLAVGFRRPHLPFSVPHTYWQRLARNSFPAAADTGKAIGVPAFSLHHSAELRGYTDIPDLGPIDAQLSARLIRGYYTSVTFVDEQIGKIMAQLKASGLDKNTIVVLLSDHGFHLGEHGMWGKTTNSKIDTRVPLIVVDPAISRQPRSSQQVVQLVDLYATLAQLCDLPEPVTDGRSLLPLLKGRKFRETGLAFSQFPGNMKFKERPEVMGYAVHSTNFGYTEWIDLASDTILARELYDYRKDPAEHVNLAQNPAYRKQLKAFSRSIRKYRR
ncbi:sulfatase [Pedobacter sp. SYP-B3415]|uniref:sulfatase n=1 Tax=Pedobacter sp. SYP-B3415 TaxID=2496641 RepID=UPI00101BFF70|nr:sulfatase [Pedobacter sp. SYP-B3415]